MGQDVHCIATWNGRRSIGTASLETDDILFRGEFRLRIPFKTVTDLTSDEGRLTVTIAEGTAIFNLGVRAQPWAERIRNPKGVLDKLGIKPEMAVSVLGVGDEWFLDELTARVEDLHVGKVARSSDVIIAAISTPKNLTLFEKLQGSLKKDGAIWAVRPKGVPAVSEATVMNAARDAGLVDVKVVRFSDTHTAEKFVRPKLAR
jgi:hypothetical protein